VHKYTGITATKMEIKFLIQFFANLDGHLDVTTPRARKWRRTHYVNNVLSIKREPLGDDTTDTIRNILLAGYALGKYA
jgi:hypothetical protein